MSKRIILTFKQTFDLTDPIEEALAEDGLTIDKVGRDSLESLAMSEMEDYDFNKRASQFMTVELVEEKEDDDEAPA